jgi:hypothetical protein
MSNSQIHQPQLFPASPLVHKAEWMSNEEQVSLKKNAKDQEGRILAYFELHIKGSPSQVFAAVAKPGEPITSIRRAISNLTKDGRLIKTDELRKGQGASEHVWRLSK